MRQEWLGESSLEVLISSARRVALSVDKISDQSRRSS